MEALAGKKKKCKKDDSEKKKKKCNSFCRNHPRTGEGGEKMCVQCAVSVQMLCRNHPRTGAKKKEKKLYAKCFEETAQERGRRKKKRKEKRKCVCAVCVWFVFVSVCVLWHMALFALCIHGRHRRFSRTGGWVARQNEDERGAAGCNCV
jgi:hypothetical protein